MTEFSSIIDQLERQRTAIETALGALREVEGIAATAPATVASIAPIESSVQKKYKLSAAARERMSQGQRKRYAHLHTVSEPATPATLETSGRMGKKRTAAQRRRMAEAQRRRFAILRGESKSVAAPILKALPAKRQISAEGLKNIIAATKRRWALKRAEEKAALEKAEAKKSARKAVAKAAKKVAPVKNVATKKSAAVPAPALAEAAAG